jgi:hypothetical protein
VFAQPGVQDGFEVADGELLDAEVLALALDDGVPVPEGDALEVGGVGVGVGQGGFTATVRVIVVDGS